MAKKHFENSIVKGFVIAKDSGISTPFETVTKHVRSVESARKAISIEMLGYPVEDADKYIIAVSEIINQKAKPVIYDDAKVFDRCVSYVDAVKDEPVPDSDKEGYVYRRINRYSISGFVWMKYRDEGDEFWTYDTQLVYRRTSSNLTKTNMRTALMLEAELQSREGHKGFEILGCDDVMKQAYKIDALIAESELANCIKQSEDEKDEEI